MNRLFLYTKTFLGDIKRSFFDLSVIIGVIAFFQFFILREIPEAWPSMLIGLIVVALGLALFLRGLENGIFPLGEELSKGLAKNSTKVWIILFAFVIGFATTIAEPALIAIADKAAAISLGAIDSLTLRLVVAFSVGFAIVLGVIRIILNHPIHWYIISGYVIALCVTYFAPAEIVGLAYDSGGVTTSTVTVPLIAALGIGLASTLKGRNPIIDGFGLIAFASLTPIIFVQLYGIIAYTFGVADTTTIEILKESGEAGLILGTSFFDYVLKFIETIGDVLPVILTLLFFYIFVLRQKVENWGQKSFGFFLVLLGLYAFVIGLEIGLFPIGESIAFALAETTNILLIYSFAFTIGFATTIAEPALTAIAKKAEEISGGAIHSLALRIFVALGVGAGILLGTYRIINGDPLVWYIMAGYLVVVLMTFFAPKTIIPIAYDSGGVTTSTVTVPIVAALGIGLASAIPGRDPLIDGFGLIAFASLFPMIAVLGYGIFETENIKRHERRIRKMENETAEKISVHLKPGHTHKSRTEKVSTHHSGVKKQIITLTGDAGSGVSSASSKIAEKLRFKRFSAGELFRKIAREHDLSVEELNKKAEEDTAVDNELDLLEQELLEKNDKIIVDSSLAYHWAHSSFKVYLKVSPEEGAKRIYNNIRRDGRIAEEGKTVDEIKKSNKRSFESKKRRYQDLYGVDITNHKPFDLVIDTEENELDDVVEKIIYAFQTWIEEKTKD